MNLFYWITLLSLIQSIILVGGYSAALVRIGRGSKLVNVSIMTGLLLLANILFAVSIVPYYILIHAFYAGDYDRASQAVVWSYVL
jgi:hypothetical protein